MNPSFLMKTHTFFSLLALTLFASETLANPPKSKNPLQGSVPPKAQPTEALKTTQEYNSLQKGDFTSPVAPRRKAPQLNPSAGGTISPFNPKGPQAN